MDRRYHILRTVILLSKPGRGAAMTQGLLRQAREFCEQHPNTLVRLARQHDEADVTRVLISSWWMSVEELHTLGVFTAIPDTKGWRQYVDRMDIQHWEVFEPISDEEELWLSPMLSLAPV